MTMQSKKQATVTVRDNKMDENQGSKVEAICQALIRSILSRELTPGMKLSEETLGAIFKVSRTLVRSALNRLHSESLVEFRKNRGAFVATPSVREIKELFHVRILLEKDVAASVAGKLTKAHYTVLAGNISRHRKTYRAGHDAEAMRLSEEFHLLLAKMAGNAVLEGLLERLVTRTSLALSLYRRRYETECGLDEHEELLALFKQGKPEAASALMAKHLEDVLVRTHLGGPEDDVLTLENILSKYA